MDTLTSKDVKVSHFYFGVEPFDPTNFTAVAVALMLSALVACAIPTRRAARIDAIAALRR